MFLLGLMFVIYFRFLRAFSRPVFERPEGGGGRGGGGGVQNRARPVFGGVGVGIGGRVDGVSKTLIYSSAPTVFYVR